MKRFLVFAVLAISIFSSFAERYRINDVQYNISGMTKKYAIEKAIKINKTRIFESYDELNSYVENLRQLFNNERNFASSIINLKYDNQLDEQGISNVTLIINTLDSKHFLLVPYPKYNSNDGFLLKLKAKDTNFLGTLETLDFALNFAVEKNSKTDENDISFGIDFDYDYPFKAGIFDSSWNNKMSFEWTIGKDKPEFSYKTGFTFELPFKNYSLKLDLTQSIVQNFDYTEYDDELYFTEFAKFSLPLKIAEIENYGDVKWTPYSSFTINWDKNGINEQNDDLSSPSLEFGHGLSSGRVNWYENLRKGSTFSLSQFAGYNYQRNDYYFGSKGEMDLFYCLSNIGINARFIGFYYLNKTEKIGSYLRGIRDNQTYDDSAWQAAGFSGSAQKALSTNAAIIANIDFPIHIITTDWLAFNDFIFGEDSAFSNRLKWMRFFDFELQINPFIDFALTHNKVTGKTFAIKDGWYAGGIEVLVYPKKWRSLVVRASAGIDGGRKIINKVVSKLFDNSWRSEGSALEISIGIGLHY